MTFRWIENNPFNRDLAVWTRAFVGDMLPRPLTPLGWDLVWAGAGVDGWRDAMVDRMGFAESEISVENPELIGVFGGYAYVNVSLLRIWAARTPALAPNHIDTAYFLEHPEMPVYVPAPWHDDAGATQGPLTKWLSWVLVEQSQSEVEAGHVLSTEVRANRPDLPAMSDVELVEYAFGLKPLVRALASQHLNQTLAASIGPGIVAAVCDEVGLPTNATALIAALGDVDSVAPVHVTWTLSRMVRASGVLSMMFDNGIEGLDGRLRSSDEVEVLGFVAGLDALIDEVGYRGVVEWEPRGATWEADPDLLLWSIDQLRTRTDEADPAHAFAVREANRRSLLEQIGDSAAAKPVTKEHFDAAVKAVETFVRGRERSKANVARVIHEIRLALGELGDRAARRSDVATADDLHMLFADEVEYYADGGLAKIREIADERRAVYKRLGTLTPPFVLKTEAPPIEEISADHGPWASRLSDREPDGPGGVLFGKPASPGSGRGRARVVTDDTEPLSLRHGEVLVAPIVSAQSSPLFVGASAIVVESGGLLSHAAIIARELGVPMVVRAANATTRIVDGAVVEVDGATGVVTVVEGPPST
ncbi:MAG: PEP-utilizing enzyme [Acidimicrobiales bacterium]